MCATSDGSEANRPGARWWRRLFHRRARVDAPILSERAARRLARSLPLTEPFSLEALLRQVEAFVGVRVDVQPFPARTVQAWKDAAEQLPAALCIPGETRIYVFYREDTAPAHQRHSILHELGHVCARHLPAVEVAEPELDKATLTLAKHRSHYADAMERAAEAFAYTMQSRIGLMRPQNADKTDPKYQEAVERYGSILEG